MKKAVISPSGLLTRISLILFSSVSLTLAQDWEWVCTARDDRGNAGNAVGLDLDGEAFVTGNFVGQPRFGQTLLGGSNAKGSFLAKYHPEGANLWAAQLMGTNDVQGAAVALEGELGVVFVGSFAGTVEIGGTSLTSRGNRDIFLAKLDHDGRLVWARQAGGNGPDAATSVALDVDANIYVTGFFSGAADFGTNHLTSSGSNDMFIAEYDWDGNLIWVTKGGGVGNTASTKASGICLDQQNNIYLVGTFSGMTAQFGTTNLTSSGAEDAFLIKYDQAGQVVWAQAAGGSGSDSATAIVLDAYGDAYLAGSFSGNAAFGTNFLASSGGTDAFLAKYDSDGNGLWARRAGGAAADAATAVAFDLRGNVELAGYFNLGGPTGGTASFGTNTLISNGDSDLFVAEYDADGKVLWAYGVGGTGPEAALGLAVNKDDETFVTGYFTSPSVAFGDVLVQNSVLGARHYFLAKLGIEETLVGPIIISTPQGITSNLAETVTFSVTATTSETVHYQWRFNGTNLVNGGRISGADTATLTITDLQPGDAGSYSVVVTDMDGSSTTSSALLSVLPTQKPPEVAIGMYSGLMINGKPGKTYTVKYATDLGEPVRWTNLTTVTLTNNVQVWIDPDAAHQKGRRFYSVEP